MATCRVCGSDCRADELRPAHEGGGCTHCNGSPACSRCGHARKHHRGMFGGGAQRCEARVAAEHGIAVGRCGCAGYTTDPAAFGQPVELVEPTDLRLRPLRRPDERLPWRPHE